MSRVPCPAPRRVFRMVGRHLARADGQTTAEYALVIIGAAVIAGLLAKWAAGGAIADLFQKVIDKITSGL